MPKYRTAWQKKRQEVIARAKGQCEECRERPGAHVHHKRYSAKGRGHEPLHWLVLLCIPCHQRKHPKHEFLSVAAQRVRAAERKRRRRRKPKPPPCAWCGNRYSPEKHQAICVKYGVDTRKER